MTSVSDKRAGGFPDFLDGDGEMRTLIREFDWASTPVGAPETWPQSLRLTVRLMLNSQHPMFIWWGPDLIQFYNDGYRQTMGTEMHPAALGAKGRESWAAIWPIIGPQIEYVMAGKGATWNERQMVPIHRHGGVQEVWWTYGYSPIDLDGDVGGVLVVCTDVTAHHLLTEELRSRNKRLARLFEDAPGFIAMLEGPEHVFELANGAYRKLIGGRDVVGKSVLDALPEVERQGFIQLLNQVRDTGESYVGRRVPVTLDGGAEGMERRRYLDFIYQPITDSDGAVTGIFVEGQDVTEHVDAERRLGLINRELQHRVKNVLTVVSAMANQTLRPAMRSAEFDVFRARLQAMADAQDALTGHTAKMGGELGQVIRSALAPHLSDERRVEISGPAVPLGSKQAMSVALAFHELATNAVKYGALSNDAGRVAVSWSLDGGEGEFRLSWRECGGPAVRPPATRGFGSRLIKTVLEGEFGGRIDQAYEAEGLRLVVIAPERALSERSGDNGSRGARSAPPTGADDGR